MKIGKIDITKIWRLSLLIISFANIIGAVWNSFSGDYSRATYCLIWALSFFAAWVYLKHNNRTYEIDEEIKEDFKRQVDYIFNPAAKDVFDILRKKKELREDMEKYQVAFDDPELKDLQWSYQEQMILINGKLDLIDWILGENERETPRQNHPKNGVG